MKRIAIIALFLAVPLIAQTSKPVPASQTTFISDCSTHPEACISTTTAFVMNPVDAHGCNFIAQWDAEKKVCAMHFTFSSDMTPPITCSPVAKDGDHQAMVCWYTPTPAPA